MNNSSPAALARHDGAPFAAVDEVLPVLGADDAVHGRLDDPAARAILRAAIRVIDRTRLELKIPAARARRRTPPAAPPAPPARALALPVEAVPAAALPLPSPPCLPCAALSGAPADHVPHLGLRPFRQVLHWSSADGPLRLTVYRCRGCGSWMRRSPELPGGPGDWRLEPLGR